MHAATLIAAILAPAALALPTPEASTGLQTLAALASRQGKQVTFCEKATPAPSANETEARFNKFAEAFIVKKDLVEAFSYIAPEYINHNPAARNGAQFAYDFLSPIWSSQQIIVIRTLFREPMGWLNYRSGFGTIVDRYRWEGGCIVEHWDSGETMPAKAK